MAFTRNTTPKIKFKAVKLVPNKSVTISGESEQGISISEVTKMANAAGEVTVEFTPTEGQFADSVKYYKADGDSPFAIKWKAKYGSGDAQEITKSKHTVCLTRSKPHANLSSHQETTFVLACKNAEGMTDESAIIQGIWNEFSDRKVFRVSDGALLKYYGDYDTEVETSIGLIKGTDGQCHAWLKLFTDMLRVHGISNISKVELTYGGAKDSSQGFIVKNWQFHDLRSQLHPDLKKFISINGGIDHPYVNVRKVNSKLSDWFWTMVKDQAGIEGQGNQNPKAKFDKHYIVKINGKYYDPSYGGEIYNGLTEYENKNIEGLWRKRNNQIFPEKWVNEDINGSGRIDYVVTNGVEIYFIKPNPSGNDLVPEEITSF